MEDIMKITDTISASADITSAKLNNQANKSNENTKAESGASNDKVTLSNQSAELKAIASTGAANGTFDVEKVQAIKSAIVSGDFKVDTGKVADGLINTVKDLLSSQKA